MANEFPVERILLQTDGDAGGYTIDNLGRLKFKSTFSSLARFNTADETTNYEKLTESWAANVFTVAFQRGGTGVGRGMAFTFANNDAAGTFEPFAIRPTVSQSGTAAYTAFILDSTESSVGSGTKRLFSFRVGGNAMFECQHTSGVFLFGNALVNSSVLVQSRCSTNTPTDSVFLWSFYGKDSASGTQLYAGLNVSIVTATAGSEIGAMQFQVTNGAITGRVFEINGNGYGLFPEDCGLQFHNSGSDEVTNYERANLFWSSNVFTLAVEKAGTGVGRTMEIIIAGNEASSGVVDMFTLSPTIAQTGTAGYNGFVVDVTESSTGSGVTNLADFRLGGTSKVLIDDTGNIFTAVGGSPPYEGSLFIGGSSATTAFLVLHQAAGIIFRRPSGGTADEKVWSWESVSGRMLLSSFDDSLSSRTRVIEIDRSGLGSTDINYFSLLKGRMGIGTATTVTPSARLHVKEATIGAMVFKMESVTSADAVTNEIKHYREETLDATVTPLATIALTADQTTDIHVRVYARRTGGVSGTAQDGARYFIRGAFKMVGGSAVQIGSGSADTPDEDQAGWACAFAVSAGNVLVNVTGAVGNTITWHAIVDRGFVGT